MIAPDPRTEAWMRRCHSAWVQGCRVDDVRDGERVFQRWQKRLQRSRRQPAEERA